MIRNVDMVFEFKNTIPRPPQTADDMYKQAASNDTVTVNKWREEWIANVRANKERFGNFKDHGVGRLFGINRYRPCIVVGSGPSLGNSLNDTPHESGKPRLSLKDTKGIMVVSCLHNYQYMVDNNIKVDYYVSLDAGAVVIDEISEGGKLTHEEYVESTRDKKLIAFVGSNPRLFDNWKGEVYLFNCPVPDETYMAESFKVEDFHTMVSTGGNVLGACTYIAKAIFGSNPIIFCGADFCFSYTRKFHAWPSKYDANIGEAIRCVDVWGNGVLTWGSYYNFKIWFDRLCSNVPEIYINCTEGGLLGSYPEGNIAAIKQMTLDECLWSYTMFEEIRQQCEQPETMEKKVLF